jgi:hypothetical protein
VRWEVVDEDEIRIRLRDIAGPESARDERASAVRGEDAGVVLEGTILDQANTAIATRVCDLDVGLPGVGCGRAVGDRVVLDR